MSWDIKESHASADLRAALVAIENPDKLQTTVPELFELRDAAKNWSDRERKIMVNKILARLSKQL
jgi:hypothetical protein